MDRKNFVLAILLSAVVIIGWQVAMRRFFPNQGIEEPIQLDQPAPAREQAPIPQPAKPIVSSPDAKPAGTAGTGAAQKVEPTQAPEREITLETTYWKIKFTSHGAVATSWILKKDRKPSGVERPITGANGEPLELIPQESVEPRIYPLSLRTPMVPELSKNLNGVNYKIDGVPADQSKIELAPGEKRELVFTYSSASVESKKTFTFSADSVVFDAAVAVKSGGVQQPIEIVIGPRIGDQSDTQTGSYSTPPQIVGLTMAEKTERVVGSRITPAFASVVSIGPGDKQITLDKPLAGDVDSISILTSIKDKEPLFVAGAKVVDREGGGHVLTLDQVPPGTHPGSGVAQAADIIRQPFKWVGLVNHYFAMIAVPDQPISEIALTNINLMLPDGGKTVRSYPSVAVPIRAGGRMRIFVGAKDRDLLAQVGPEELRTDLSSLIDYGMFAPIIRPIVPIIGGALGLSSRLFHNYGWGIVLVTIALNLLLSPLRMQSSKKMKQAAKHQPRLKELQDRMKKLKADASKKNEREIEQLQREQMELMKEANPLGGCLPMLLQMPVFWAIFVYLTISLDVRRAPWILWVKDLSAPDPLHILPIVMCVTMIAQSLIQPMPPSTDPSQKMQKMMMTWLMPVMLTYFFFFSAPSGLVLYWMVSNIVGAGIQYLINKKPSPADAKTAPSDSPGSAAPGDRRERGKKLKSRAPEKEIAGSVK